MESEWGLCPICKKNDGCLNIGADHWYFCLEHRVRWCIGSNLFSYWRDETEAEQRSRCEEIGFDTFKEVEPFFPPFEVFNVAGTAERTNGDGRHGNSGNGEAEATLENDDDF